MHLAINELRRGHQSCRARSSSGGYGFFATAGKPLNLALLPEVVIGLGCVPLVE